MPLSLTEDFAKVEIAKPEKDAGHDEGGADIAEELERLEHRVDADNGRSRPLHVVPVRADETARPGLPRFDGDVRDCELFFPCLDDRLERIGVVGNEVQTLRRLARKSAEATRRVGNVGPRDLPHDPASQRLKPLLGEREMFHARHLPVAHHHVGLTAQYRPNERRNRRTRILVVAVSIDDDVRPQLERRVDPGLERRRQPPTPRRTYDVIHTVLPRNLRRSVRRSIVEQQNLNLVDAFDMPRNFRKRLRKRPRLIQARNLNNEFHVSEA